MKSNHPLHKVHHGVLAHVSAADARVGLELGACVILASLCVEHKVNHFIICISWVFYIVYIVNAPLFWAWESFFGLNENGIYRAIFSCTWVCDFNRICWIKEWSSNLLKIAANCDLLIWLPPSVSCSCKWMMIILVNGIWYLECWMCLVLFDENMY